MNKTLILNKIKSAKGFGSNNELADFLGISKATLSNWYNRNSMDYDLVLDKCSDLDINWLFNDSLPELDHVVKLINSDNQKSTNCVLEEQYIPLYDLEASAGLVELFKSDSPARVLGSIKIPNLPKCDGAITVTGDSMYPLLKSGDTVLFKQVNIDSIFFGEMYLLSVKIDDWEEYVCVKYVQKSENGPEYIKLVSYNQNHQPKDIKLTSVAAIALIKASIRYNTMM